MPWLTMGVKTSIPWPQKLQIIKYENKEIELIPESKDCPPCVRIEIKDSAKGTQEGREFLNRFFSILSWISNSYISETLSIGSGTKGAMIGKSVGFSSILTNKLNDDYLPTNLDETQRLSLALYREAQALDCITYKFLGYFKILNIKFKTGKDHSCWINQNLEFLKNDEAIKKVEEIKASHENVGKYLYTSGRCAVAHAFNLNDLVNPDNPFDAQRLYKELPIIKELAEIFIEEILGIKSKRKILSEHLYELAGIKKIIPSDLLKKILLNDLDSSDKIKLPQLSIGEQYGEIFETFKGMTATSLKLRGGKLTFWLKDKSDVLLVPISFDFHNETLEWDLFNCRINVELEQTHTQYLGLLHLHQFQRQMILNGNFCIFDSKAHNILGRKDSYIPVNIDPGEMIKYLDRKIEALRLKCTTNTKK